MYVVSASPVSKCAAKAPRREDRSKTAKQLSDRVRPRTTHRFPKSQFNSLSAFLSETLSADRLICFSGKVQPTRFAWSQQSFKSCAFTVVGGTVIFHWLKSLFAKQPVGNHGSGPSLCCWHLLLSPVQFAGVKSPQHRIRPRRVQ